MSNKRELEFARGQRERHMSDEDREISHVFDEARLRWIDRSAKDLPWLREIIAETSLRSGPMSADIPGTKGRRVAYVDLRTDTPKDGEFDLFMRRTWYVLPHDHKKKRQIPSEAVSTQSIAKGQPSRPYPDDKPP